MVSVPCPVKDHSVDGLLVPEIGLPLAFHPAPTGPVDTGILYVSQAQRTLVAASSHPMSPGHDHPWHSADFRGLLQRPREDVIKDLKEFSSQMASWLIPPEVLQHEPRRRGRPRKNLTFATP